MSSDLVSMDYDTFCESFKPIKNHLNSNAPEDGCMFETFGEELDYVIKVAKNTPNKVLTILEDDEGRWCIGEGYHLVNRLGYLITEESFDEKIEYYIYDDFNMLDDLEDLP